MHRIEIKLKQSTADALTEYSLEKYGTRNRELLIREECERVERRFNKSKGGKQ